MISSIEDMVNLCVLVSPASNADDDISDFFLFGKDNDSQHGVHWDQVGQVMEDQQGTSKSFQQLKQTWDDYKHITNYNVLL